MTDFHFLRPEWLLLLLLVPLSGWLWRQLGSSAHGWQGRIPRQLLAPLLPSQGGSRNRRFNAWPGLLLLIAGISLAGPAWRETPQPLQARTDSLVIVLDLSLSMLATDLSPNRLTRAKQKIRDLLQEREGALTGLVVYAQGAHTVVPLTDDRRTIENLLPPLSPFIMPENGSRPDRGITRALELLESGARGPARLLLMTDGILPEQGERIADMLAGTPYRLDVLAIGTSEGGPIPLPDRGFITENGETVIAPVPLGPLSDLARAVDGKAARLTLGEEDLEALKLTGANSGDWQKSDRTRTLDRWHDDGYWLLWLLAPLALLAWRRGALTLIACTLLWAPPDRALALEWADLWKRADQQAMEQLKEDPAAAAQKFEDPLWRGTALYRAGDYEAAARAFARRDSARAHYNRGNALARAGQLAEAIEAYEQALARQPDMADAKHNKALVEELLQKQQQQKQKQQQQKQKQQQQPNQGGAGSSSGQSSGEGQQQPSKGGRQGSQSRDSGQPSRQQDAGPKPEEESGQTSTGSQPEPSQSGSNESGEQQARAMPDELTEEERRSRDQWLRRVPDDPAGLLRRKFLHQYRQQQPSRQDDEEKQPW